MKVLKHSILILMLLMNSMAVSRLVVSLKITPIITWNLSSYFLTNTSITKKRPVFLN
ncbi:hypothetical protein MGAS27061_1450 [Streptococcus pyogenes]|nr:hypothetical protein MGAS27061_1450 [Streptococcus pyogenes]